MQGSSGEIGGITDECCRSGPGNGFLAGVACAGFPLNPEVLGLEMVFCLGRLVPGIVLPRFWAWRKVFWLGWLVQDNFAEVVGLGIGSWIQTCIFFLLAGTVGASPRSLSHLQTLFTPACGPPWATPCPNPNPSPRSSPISDKVCCE